MRDDGRRRKHHEQAQHYHQQRYCKKPLIDADALSHSVKVCGIARGVAMTELLTRLVTDALVARPEAASTLAADVRVREVIVRPGGAHRIQTPIHSRC